MGLSTLNTEHYVAIKWLALPKKGGRTYEQVADIVGCHVQSIYNWKRDPLFVSELKREIVRNTHDRLPEVLNSMIDFAIKDGSAAAAKLVLTANDMLKDQVEITTDNKEHKDIDDIKAKLAAFKGKTITEDKE